MNPQVIIIGGGLSGLTAARVLHEKNIDFVLLEASERIGGRVKTDNIDGFKLDHGFQVLLTEYPEVRRWLDYSKLDLRPFSPGALLLYPDGTQDRLGDPLRDFSSLFPTLFSKVGNLKDKLSILSLRNRLQKLSIEQIFAQEELTTIQVLREEYGFSEQMIEQFFTPFFAGIFLEKDITTSRRMFDFVFKMFSEGDTAVPNLGMEEIPKLLAAPLPKASIILNTRAIKIDNQTVHLENGSTYTAPHIIIATEATGLVQGFSSEKPQYQSTTHLHFTAEEDPIKKTLIALNTKKERLINNVCTINTIAPGYAPQGHYLISASIVGQANIDQDELIEAAKKELQLWFGKQTQNWKFLHGRTVHYALPNQSKVKNDLTENDITLRDGLYKSGDHLLNGSIHAAMKSGRLVGEYILQKMT
ncbi:MAG: NAD(P)/FAD-dependent oxidoreductase [Saprospiraceae bacterium]|nr:NAD(P)/FAD-dependent oxidoreductase [Saprospiraceae bacterium]